jgi:hypothetical protein
MIEVDETTNLSDIILGLSRSQQRRLSLWIKQYAKDKAYSCGTFCAFMTHTCNAPRSGSTQIEYKTSSEPTSCVYLHSKTRTSRQPTHHHFALCLAAAAQDKNQRFLSQWGNGGAIMISTLADMHLFFKTDSIRHVLGVRETQL